MVTRSGVAPGWQGAVRPRHGPLPTATGPMRLADAFQNGACRGLKALRLQHRRCTSSTSNLRAKQPMNHKPAPTTRTEINHAIRAPRTATEHYSIKPSDNSIRTTTATRSKDSHLCITIRRPAPASGRRGTRLVAVDRVTARLKIIKLELATGMRPSWC